ncbi:MAG: PQQ-binding-like beta-propeller repeat protein [Deltaproteobacteria bacterium]
MRDSMALSAIAPASGAELWRSPLPLKGPGLSLHVCSERAYVCGQGAVVEVALASGAVSDVVPIEDTAELVQFFADRFVFLRLAADRSFELAGLDFEGVARWVSPLERHVAFACGDANTYFAALYEGPLRAVDVADGRVRWERDASALGEVTDYAMPRDRRTERSQWSVTPIVFEDLLVVGASGGWMLGLDCVTGETRWQTSIDVLRPSWTTLDNAGTILVPGQDQIVEIEADTGTVRHVHAWRTGQRDAPPDPPRTIAADPSYLWLAVRDRIAAINRSNGQVIAWSEPSGGQLMWLAALGDRILGQDVEGRLRTWRVDGIAA